MSGFKSVELIEHANEIIFSPGMQSRSDQKNIRHISQRGWATVVQRRRHGGGGNGPCPPVGRIVSVTCNRYKTFEKLPVSVALYNLFDIDMV